MNLRQPRPVTGNQRAAMGAATLITDTYPPVPLLIYRHSVSAMRCKSWSNDFFGWFVICVIYGRVPLSIVRSEFIITRRPIRLTRSIGDGTRRWIRILLR